MMISNNTKAQRPVRRTARQPDTNRTRGQADTIEAEPPPEPETVPTDPFAAASSDDDFLDANSNLIDELERILHGDLGDSDGQVFDHAAEGGFPLIEPERQPDPEPELEPAPVLARLPARIRPAPADLAPEPLTPSAGFWHADEIEMPNAPPLAAEQPAPPSRTYLTVGAVILLIAAGGAYAVMQTSRDPLVSLPEGTTIASAAAATTPAIVWPGPETADVPITPAATAGDPANTPETPAETAETPVAEPTGGAAPEPRRVETVTVAPDGAIGGPFVPAAEPPAPETAVAVPPPAEPAAAPPPEPTPEPATGTPPEAALAGATTATVTTWLNLRATPSMTGAVVMVLPQGATVEVIGCPAWCEVVYEGNRGYVGPDYLSPRP